MYAIIWSPPYFLDKSNLFFSLDEVETFIDHVDQEAPVVTQHTELPQLKYKLLHFKDKIEKKKQLVICNLCFSIVTCK